MTKTTTMTTTDKDQLIADLKAEIATLKNIIWLMPGNVYWKSITGEYLGCNNNVARALNLTSPDEIKGKATHEIMNNERAYEVNKVDLEIMRNKLTKRAEEYGVSPEGTPATYLTEKTPLFTRDGKLEGLLGVSLDITSLKELEEKLKIAKQRAEAANRAKSQFLAVISHELRTPLTSLLGFVSFLEKENLSDKEKKQYIQYILNSGNYLHSLINNLLDYNKLETNNYELNLVSLNLKDLLQNVISILSGSSTLKGLQLILDYDSAIPDYIVTDGSALMKILINLAGNAIKFTEKGNVTIRVKQILSRDNISELLFAVEDTGIGISLEDQRAIFKRFYQAGDVYTRQTSLTGTGLGLAIVKKLVKLLDSKIEISSIPGQGSKFYFIIRCQHSPVSMLEKLETPHSKPLSTSKLNVLLIEDDALIQIVHKRMLEELNCHVNIADSGKKALDMLSDNYDVLFVDIGLPDMGGFELIKRIREQHAISKKIPIIALTGYSEKEEHQQCIQAGADEVAVKPISKPFLETLLKRYLSA